MTGREAIELAEIVTGTVSQALCQAQGSRMASRG